MSLVSDGAAYDCATALDSTTALAVASRSCFALLIPGDKQSCFVLLIKRLLIKSTFRQRR
jgi:hypothetical protein